MGINILWLTTWGILTLFALHHLFSKTPLSSQSPKSNTLLKIWPLIVCIYFILSLVLTDNLTTNSGENIRPVMQWSLLLLSTFLTFLAFYVQYQFNIKQKNDIGRERFEQNFFQYIELISNQERACEITGVGIGKQVFHFMFYEYKAILYLIHKSKAFCETDSAIEHKELLQAYRLFINGVSTTAMTRLSENCNPTTKNKISYLNNLLLQARKKDERPRYLSDYNTNEILLFDGHRLRLVPYYRTIVMVIQFLQKAVASGCINENECGFYHRVLLSQMSEHQISLLYIMYLCDTSNILNSSNKEHEHAKFIVEDKDAPIVSFFEEVLPQYIQASTMNPLSNNFIITT